MKMFRDLLRAFRLQLAAGGVKGGARLMLALSMKLAKPAYTRLGAGDKQCPCCGWRGSNFLPYIDAGYVTFRAECPLCRSHPRHRAHNLFYRRFFPGIQGDLLYIAPERNVDYFRGQPGLRVRTSEYLRSAPADYHYDLLAVDCPDATWDYIVCHRVIEHVRDDRRAMRELYRVLKPGGTAVISVPIEPDLPHTLEYDEPNPLESDHYYRYGADFAARIPAEFAVEAHEFRSLFTTGEFAAMALCDDYLYLCRRRQ